MRRKILIVSSFLVFLLFNYSIIKKERLIERGETVLLALAPVDPRSLMQGDYMRLRYEIEQKSQIPSNEKRGYMVVTLDKNRVAQFRRFYTGEELAQNEKLLHFHGNGYGGIKIVPDSFMFQEGHATVYGRAKYGVFKFDRSGEHLLIGLAGEDFLMIRPGETH